MLTANRFVDSDIGISYRYVFSDTEYFRPHYHDYYELFLMLDGNAIHRVNGTDIPLSQGCVVFIRPHDTHDYLCAEHKRFSMLNITFTEQTFKELFVFLAEGFNWDYLLTSHLPPEVHLNDYDFKSVCNKMDNIRAISPNNRTQIKTALRIFLFTVFTKYFFDYEKSDYTIPIWLENMCNKMQKNGNFALGSDYFFSLTDKSREHVSRCMKRYTGMTVTEYINTLRLNYIANMLRNSNHSISYIVYESGFNNLSWASEQFRHKYGITMKDYRNSKNK